MIHYLLPARCLPNQEYWCSYFFLVRIFSTKKKQGMWQKNIIGTLVPIYYHRSQQLYIVVLNVVLITFIDCQSFSTCNSTCSWGSCCSQIGCTNCNHTFYCQTEIITGNVSWCTVQMNGLLTPSLINTINITFQSTE